MLSSRRILLAALAAIASLRGDGADVPPAAHPLDGLSAREHWAVFEALKASGRTSDETRFVGVELQEPPKAEVLAWRKGQPFGREALAVVTQGAEAYEALVDVTTRKVLSWTRIVGQPPLPDEEWHDLEDRVKEDPGFLAALKQRGIVDLETVDCFGAVYGDFDTELERGRRLARFTCSDRRGAWSSQFRPIEGLVVLVDLDTRKVLRVIDTGPRPFPEDSGDVDADSVEPTRPPARPILVQQPQGPGFTLEGREVSWQNWRFHFRIDPLVGPVVSLAKYRDGDAWRDVLYQGALTEIFVPYMDPEESWYFVSYFDISGQAGGTAARLERGTDCPAHAQLFDTVHADSRGMPKRHQDAACLFERETGDPAWRHGSEDAIESRRRRDLVLRAILTIGNYDYVLDWEFHQDGSIRILAGATGMVNVKAVEAKRVEAVPAAGEAPPDAYGRLIRASMVAVNHDHFLSYRLDLDVDGPQNSVVVDRITPQRLPAASPRKSLWTVQSQTLRSEHEGSLHMNMERPSLWRVTNPARRGPTGYPVSYQLRPGHTAMSLLAPEDNPQVRGGFSSHTLWVTRQDDRQRLAAGPYSTGAKRAGGVPAWAAADRPLENADVVLWYTMGMHHVVRAEDWPVMPVVWHELELRPFDFFPRNPALDLPR